MTYVGLILLACIVVAFPLVIPRSSATHRRP